MSAPLGFVRVQVSEHTVTFRVEGWAGVAHSVPLRRFAEEALQAGATTLRVDLRHCTHIDSTFLGTLLQLKRQTGQLPEAHLVLVSPSVECTRIFRQMGVDGYFTTEITDEEERTTWTDLPENLGEDQACRRHVVQAHQELARVDGPAGETFRALLKLLARQNPEVELPQ